MVKFEDYTKVYRAPAIIPALIGAAVAVGTAVYTAKKADQAAADKRRTDSMFRKEAMELEGQKTQAQIDRERAQAAAREGANQNAEDAQMNSMERIADNEAKQRALEKEMAAKDPQAEYATKFKPGQGSVGGDTASDFLVPKVADDTGLVRSKDSEGAGSAGLLTPLTFNV